MIKYRTMDNEIENLEVKNLKYLSNFYAKEGKCRILLSRKNLIQIIFYLFNQLIKYNHGLIHLDLVKMILIKIRH